MSENRIGWLDVLKFFGIFAIYLGHFGSEAGMAYEFVFSFHVALFFFVAGCAESISRETPILDYIKKKTISLLLPWLVFAILSLFLEVIAGNSPIEFVKDSLLIILKGTIRNSYFAFPLWFFTCLYVVSILFQLIKKVKYKPLILISSLLCFVIAEKFLAQRPLLQPSLPFNLDSALYYIVFFAIGFISFPSINNLLQFKTAGSKRLFYISGALSLVYSSLLFFGKDLLGFMYAVPVIYFFKPILTSLVVIWFFICLSYTCRNVNLFIAIGQNTLYLCGNEYIIKQLFVMFFSVFSIKLSFTNPLSLYIYSFILLYTGSNLLIPLEKRLIGKITAFNFTK